MEPLRPLSDRPLVSVVIPCRNEMGFIGACLESIVAADRSGMDLTVFVCDGMSDDGCREEIERIAADHAFIMLLDNTMRTTPHALNLGLRKQRCDVGIILGAHAEVGADFFTRNIAALRSDPLVGCAGGVIESVHSDATSRAIGLAMAHPFGVGSAHFRTGLRSGYVDTVAFGAYRQEVFDQVGYFDEALVRNQDDEFNFRVTQAGFHILLDPAIRSRYVVRASFQKLWKQYFQYGYWKVYVNSKHGIVTTFRQLVPAAWVAFLCAGPVLALMAPRFVLNTWLCGVSLYVLVAAITAIRIGGSSAMQVLYSFLNLHMGYGFGYWKGILHFVLLGRGPAKSSEALTR